MAETTGHKAPSDENTTTPTDAETKENFELPSLSQRRAHLLKLLIFNEFEHEAPVVELRMLPSLAGNVILH